MTMPTLRARVHNGRLVLDEPTDLPEGEVVYLQPVDADDDRHAEVVRRVDSIRHGEAETLSLAEVEQSLRAELDF
jgi:hypothetical protein